jgi:hypothetical protein
VAQTQVFIAQGTAIEAARINAQATAQHESYLRALVEATTQAEKINALKIQTTATAAGTSIPLTATAQANNNKAIATQQVLMAAQMTATREAPDVLREMKAAQVYNATVDFWIQVWAYGMFGVFALAVPVALFTFPRKSASPKIPAPITPADFAPIPVMPPVQETVIRVQRTGAFPRMDRLVVPCSETQWDDFARGVILQGLSLAINNWEGAERPFTREEYIALRNWMQANQLTQSAGGGSSILSARGEEFLRGWIDAGEMPAEYRFEENQKAVVESA